MRRPWTAMIVAAGLGVATSAAAHSAPQPPTGGTPVIVGMWALDKDSSDRGDTVERGPGGSGGMGGPGGGMGGRGGGMGGRGGMGGGMPGGFGGRGGDRDEMRRAGRLAGDLMRPPDRLTIVTDGQAVLFTDGDGRSVRLVADGSEQERLTGDGAIKARARWDGDQLIVEERIQDGPKVTRTYLASADRRRLVIITRIEGGNAPTSPVVHHVFTKKG